MNKIVVILGPTSSGKSSLGIKLAKKFNGEIISADSRQVYTGLDIGTGKVTKAEQKIVPHHLLDVTSPKKQFTVDHYKKLATKTLKDLFKKNKLPFIVGGTAFYVYTLIDDIELPNAKPNAKLRKQLEKKSATELFKQLKKLDPVRAKTIDANNTHRLIRALEINLITGKPVPEMKKVSIYDALILGLNVPQEKLYKAIDKRLEERLKQGLIKETKKLLKSGVTHNRLQTLGLEYRLASDYIREVIDYPAMLTELKNANHHLAKRQMTWFKKDPRIQWITKVSEAEKLIKQFLIS